MEIVVVFVFVLGYLLITLEHNLKIDKLVPALLMMSIIWTIIATTNADVFEIIQGHGLHKITNNHGEAPFIQALLHHLGKTAEILFFLIGAMTIVEIIEYFHGFSTIKRFVSTNNKKKLLWIISILAFSLSAIIDNLTATIVLITILRKLIKSKEERMWFSGIIIISANSGGAWSPIGDVTTTMLWIAHKVEAYSLLKFIFIPSLVSMVIPVFIMSLNKIFKGNISPIKEVEFKNPHGFFMLIIGLGSILFVPIFKMITGLPPYIGMSISLAIVALVAEIISARDFNLSGHSIDKPISPIHNSLTRIELPSILFFLGILLAVAGLESLGILYHLANQINDALPKDVIVSLIGFGSAVIDNVPLVAASIGMFEVPNDDPFWHFLAYTSGTGGSMLIIGSAAGVVAMGMEKIDFFWYLKKISWLALIGYVIGLIAFLILRTFFT